MFNLFKKKVTFTITLIVEPDGDRFHAYCPALKGVHAEGSTEKEACDNGIDASIAYIKSLIKHGDAVPLGVEVKEEQPMFPMMPQPMKCVHQVQMTI